ncbi:plasminogen activator, urokinase a [Brachyhypopomus gauderio]|uniref:plasminogen activator, urokinase a n=1 Tax=Brachyhypopomus gauderio TaxID=698409 RepID=UPI004042AA0B
MKLLIMLLMVWALHDVAAHKTWRDSIFRPVRYSQQHGRDSIFRHVRYSHQHDYPPECVEDGSNGSEYRGTISVSSRGHRCLNWDKYERLGATARTQGLGSHKYCRNPDNSPMPWCRVKRNWRVVREFCNIPQCQVKPTTNLHQLQQDTEETCGEHTQKYKIVGGLRSTVEAQPWVASIFKGQGFLCGGTLIAPCWVLTAAHCFPEGAQTSIHRYFVYLGKNAVNETNLSKEQTFKLAKLVIHEDFTGIDYNNDIALLQIVDSSGKCARRTNSVRTACLPPADQMLPPGSFCNIAGYGREESNSVFYSRFLKEAQVNLISQSFCQSKDIYGSEVTNNMFCAASSDWTQDACKGDSGGPLVCEVDGRMFLFGVISWGRGCAGQFNPGVYTKVTNYNQWIAEHTRLPSFTRGIMYPQKD